MSTVFHFFNSPTIHHVPKMIKNFHFFHVETISKCRFVLLNFDEKYKSIYQQLELELQIKFIRIPSNRKLFFFFLTHYNNFESIFVLHGINRYYFLSNLFLPFNKNKVLWVNWGSGLNNHKGLKNIFYTMFKKILYKPLDGINTLMTPDANYLKNKIHFKKKLYVEGYFGKEPILYPNSINKYFNDNKINILIGNHSGKGNRHLKWLDELSKFKNENLRIIIFEGYGESDKDYINQLNKKGNEIFKENFFPFDFLLDMDTYHEVLKSIDILILDTEHQTGLAAIYNTSFFGGNIYLTKNGRNKEFTDELGIHTFTSDEIIKAQKLTDLLQITEQQKSENLKIIQARRKSTDNRNGWYEFLYGKN